MINHTNIDQYMFDYVEGNLSDYQSDELFQFLETNPTYLKELDYWNATKVKTGNITAGFRKENFTRKNKVNIKTILGSIVGGFTILLCSIWLLNQNKPMNQVQVETSAPVKEHKSNNLSLPMDTVKQKSSGTLSAQTVKREKKDIVANQVAEKRAKTIMKNPTSNPLDTRNKTKIDLIPSRKFKTLEVRLTKQLITKVKPDLIQPEDMDASNESKEVETKKESKKTPLAKKKGPGIIPLKVKGF